LDRRRNRKERFLLRKRTERSVPWRRNLNSYEALKKTIGRRIRAFVDVRPVQRAADS
jgi:hypothetical protein